MSSDRDNAAYAERASEMVEELGGEIPLNVCEKALRYLGGTAGEYCISDNALAKLFHIRESFEWLEKTATHESVIGVYIYPYKTGKMSINVELSSGRIIEGDEHVTLAEAVHSAKKHLEDHFEADYETL